MPFELRGPDFDLQLAGAKINQPRQPCGKQHGGVQRLRQRFVAGQEHFAKLSPAGIKEFRRARLDHPKDGWQVVPELLHHVGLQRSAVPSPNFFEVFQVVFLFDQQGAENQPSAPREYREAVIPIIARTRPAIDDGVAKSEGDGLGLQGVDGGRAGFEAIHDAKMVFLQEMPGQTEIRAKVVIMNDEGAQPVFAGKIALSAAEVGTLRLRHPSILVEGVTEDRNDVARPAGRACRRVVQFKTDKGGKARFNTTVEVALIFSGQEKLLAGFVNEFVEWQIQAVEDVLHVSRGKTCATADLSRLVVNARESIHSLIGDVAVRQQAGKGGSQADVSADTGQVVLLSIEHPGN